MSYYKILYVLSTELVHVWKSDYAVNTNFPLPSLQRGVAWEGREGEGAKKFAWRKGDLGGGREGQKINVRMDPSLSLLGSSANDLICYGRKQKLKIDCNFQFSIFRLPPKTEKLSHAPDCDIVGKVKLRLSFIFLFIVDRIKVKI